MSAIPKGAERVLVLGEGKRSFLAVVRSLGRNGVKVHGGGHDFDSAVLTSRYLSEVHYLPPHDHVSEWKDELMKVLGAHRFELVIPINDPDIILCRKFRGEIEAHCPVYLLGEKAYSVANDKMLTYELARSLGISVPRAVLIDRGTDLTKVSSDFRLPLMLKPVSSYTENDLLSKQYVKKVKSSEDLELLLNDLLSRGPVMVQEYFDGVGAGVEVLAYQGKILTKFQHLRVHEAGGGGVSTYRKSVPVDDRLLDATIKVIAALEYTGVGMLEFKVDPTSGRWVLIEINGRFWGSLPLALASGMDFPYYLYQMLIKGRRDFPQKYKEQIYCRNTSLDIAWMSENLMSNKLKVISEMSNLLLLRERNDTLVLDDPRPGLIEAGKAVRSLCSAASRKIKRMMRIPTTGRGEAKKV